MEAILIGLIVVGVLLMAAGFYFGRGRGIPNDTILDQGVIEPDSDEPADESPVASDISDR